LFHAQTSFVKNLSKRSHSKAAVIWHNDARIWRFAKQDHVAAFLALKHEAELFERLPKIGA